MSVAKILFDNPNLCWIKQETEGSLKGEVWVTNKTNPILSLFFFVIIFFALLIDKEITFSSSLETNLLLIPVE